jgi:hypothetical protein
MEHKYVFGIVALAMIAVLGVSAVSAFGNGIGFGSLNDEDMEDFEIQQNAMRTAIENEDYQTWKSLVENRIAKMQGDLTEENFGRVVEKHQEMSEFREAIHEAKESGDFSRVQELKDERGFEGRGSKQGLGKGMKSECNYNLE